MKILCMCTFNFWFFVPEIVCMLLILSSNIYSNQSGRFQRKRCGNDFLYIYKENTDAFFGNPSTDCYSYLNC
jgi:hypothetical protein